MNPSDKANTIPPAIGEIAGTITAYSVVFVGGGVFGILAAFFAIGSRFGNIAAICGILSLVLGLALGFVAREFGGLKGWTYPIVEFLAGSPFALNTAKLDKLDVKIHLPVVREAFGLEKEDDQ